MSIAVLLLVSLLSPPAFSNPSSIIRDRLEPYLARMGKSPAVYL